MEQLLTILNRIELFDKDYFLGLFLRIQKKLPLEDKEKARLEYFLSNPEVKNWFSIKFILDKSL